MTRRALISGITGQDGSYLAELLLSEGYEVHGIVRRSSSINTSRIDHLYKDPHDDAARLKLHFGDMTDGSSLRRILQVSMPHEVYNLAGQSHVRVSFDQPEFTVDGVALGTIRLLEALRDMADPNIRMYQASSSEVFGNEPAPQNEETPFRPRSPYAVGKVAAHQMCGLYREAYGMFVSCGILFNHESPRRGETFVTRKIAKAAARISQGLQERVYLGDLDARRDWGFAGDYVDAMWRMLQHPAPSDFVIATGESHSVREFAELAFAQVHLDYRDYVHKDARYLRPNEVAHLKGDASKATRTLGWTPQVGFEQLVAMMVQAELKEAYRIQR